MKHRSLNGIADRFLSEAIRNLMNGVLCRNTTGQRFFIASDIEAVRALQEAEGRFAFCSPETLALVKEKAPGKIERLNKSAKDRIRYPYPVEFKCSSGEDHIILWFERLKDER